MRSVLLENEVRELKESLKDGLVSTSIFHKNNGQPIVEYNSISTSSGAYNNIVNHTLKIFREYNLDNIDKYIIFNLEDDKSLIILPLIDYRWAILVDNSRVKLGVILKVIIPNSRKRFEEIIRNDIL